MRDAKQFKQNHPLRSNQKMLYEKLDEKKQGETVLPDPKKQPPSGVKSGRRK